MTITKMQIAFRKSQDIANGNHYAELNLGADDLSVTARSEGKARTLLEQELRLHVGKSLATERASLPYLIGTIDGHVLAAVWFHAAGQYWINVYGPDRQNHSSMTGAGMETRESVREVARQYARDCFGGIAWENR